MFAVNVVSGPGAGKTELLTHTLTALNQNYRTAAVVGDLAPRTMHAAWQRAAHRSKQILTGTMCHLEADMVRGAIAEWDLKTCDFLFIENVGDLVRPLSWDLGEDLRVLLFSVTEGEDKPLKYPTLINTADVVVLSKCDLTAAVGFDVVWLYGMRPGPSGDRSHPSLCPHRHWHGPLARLSGAAVGRKTPRGGRACAAPNARGGGGRENGGG